MAKSFGVAVTAVRRPDLCAEQIGPREVCRALERALQFSDQDIQACGLDRHDLNRALNEWRHRNS